MTQLTDFQKSIATARKRIHEANRQAGIARRRSKEDESLALMNCQLFLDTLQQETGLDVRKPENWPTVMLYITQFLHDQEQKREAAEDAAARCCDAEGFPTERGDW